MLGLLLSKLASASASDSSAVKSAKVIPGDLGRRPAEERLGALGHEQEPALGVAPVDDVRAGLDQVAEARLGRLELVLETLALGDVAGDAVDRREPAVDLAADHVDLERDRAAIAAEEVDPGRVDGPGVGHDLGVAGTRRRLPARGDVRTEVRAEHRLDVPAEHRPRPVAQERVATLRIGREDEVGRRRGQRPIADLRIAQLALEPVALAHVADGAVRADERARLVEPGRGDELGRDRRAVAGQHVDPAAELLRPAVHPRRPVEVGDLA